MTRLKRKIVENDEEIVSRPRILSIIRIDLMERIINSLERFTLLEDSQDILIFFLLPIVTTGLYEVT